MKFCVQKIYHIRISVQICTNFLLRAMGGNPVLVDSLVQSARWLLWRLGVDHPTFLAVSVYCWAYWLLLHRPGDATSSSASRLFKSLTKCIECIFFLFRLILICTSSYFGIKMLEKSYPTPLAMLRRIGSPLLPRETVVVPAAAASAYDCFLVCKSKK